MPYFPKRIGQVRVECVLGYAPYAAKIIEI